MTTPHPPPSTDPGREEARRSEGDLVTVVVPARNEEHAIGTCLDSILAQEGDLDLQVLVVDNASEDRTAQVVDEYRARDPRVEMVRHPRPSIPGALNAGLRAARGRWLVRVDAHATIPPGYVRRAIDHLRAGGFVGVGGRKDGVGETPAGRAIAAAHGSRFGVGNSLYHYGTRARPVDHVPFGAYPVAVLRELGGWNEHVEANEDYELDFRLRQRGYRLLFDPKLRIRWYCRQRIMDLFRQYRRYGRGKAAVTLLHPSSLRPRHLAPPILIVMLAGTAALAAFRPILAGALLLPYLAVLLAGSIVTAPKVGGAGAILRLPAAFVAMHVGWGLGVWEGMVRGLLRRRAGRR